MSKPLKRKNRHNVLLMQNKRAVKNQMNGKGGSERRIERVYEESLL